jgi:putative ABC transport system substrate-binding protein
MGASQGESMNNRRKLVIALGAAALAVPFASFAQAGKVPRVGFLAISGGSRNSFLQGLRELGYVDGRNVSIEYRDVEQIHAERLPALAAELVKLGVDVIVAPDPPSFQAAMKATKTIPIVMRASSDPVEEGVVASFARPGGNITGMYSLYADLNGKRLELLKEAVPGLMRVMVLLDSKGNADAVSRVNAVRRAAQALGLKLIMAEISRVEDFEPAFRAAVRERANGLLVIRAPVFNINKRKIIELAANARMPAIYDEEQYAAVGGLMAYGADLAQMHRRLAVYVDKILKGIKPGDLPIEQPTTFDMVVNMKTAKSLGIKIPNSILVRANKVIE